jgi:hypothetical protein
MHEQLHGLEPWCLPDTQTLLLVQGVGMILPIEASMHTPAHFDGVLAGTMAAVTALYVGFGSVRNLALVNHKPQLIPFQSLTKALAAWHPSA